MSKLEILKALDAEIERLRKARRILSEHDGPFPIVVQNDGKRRGPRRMSAAARKKIAAAQRARWARLKGDQKKK